ncbi:MAG: SDR family oxidoreductase [Egibacteraceae bacterium]
MEPPVRPSGKVALVTGSSRGIGAATAVLLAKAGVDAAVNYRNKRSRAEKVAEQIRALGRRALPVQADLTDADQTRRMFDQIRETFGRLDVLVLNASGGLERDVPADYAMRLNRDAQMRAVDLALPLMPDGGRIVFVTSHYAHFYPDKAVLPAYEPVAASKRAGEDALRDRISELVDRGVTLVVVSGDMIIGTITATLLEHANPGLTEHRQEMVGGALPTVEEFAAAVADAAVTPAIDNGMTIFIGSTNA